MSIFTLSGNLLEASIACLYSGPSIESILELSANQYLLHNTVKLTVDTDDLWLDLVSLYKSGSMDPKCCRLKIVINNKPAIDTGGI